VEYIEVRCLDLDPFQPLGIDATQIHFLDTFLMWCLLAESPWIPDEECDRLDDNRRLVVERGRDPDLRLTHGQRQRSIADWGGEIIAEMRRVAELLDLLEEGSPYADAITALAPRLDDPGLTPSGRLLAHLRETGEELSDAMLAIARAQRQEFRDTDMDPAREVMFDDLVEISRQQQADIEAAQTERFDDFLAHYAERARKSRVADGEVS
jgi:glutamate--cysteine ligase